MRKFLTTMMAVTMVFGATASALASPGPRAHAKTLLTFLQRYQKQQPAQVLAGLHRLSPDAHTLIGLSPNLAMDVYLRGCQADPSIRFVISGTVMTCQQAVYDLRQALQWTSLEALTQQAETQRLALVNTQRCSLGQLSRAVCDTSVRVRSRISAMQHDTTMQILRNMDPRSCTVGADPNCVPSYP